VPLPNAQFAIAVPLLAISIHPISAWTRQQLREAFPNETNARCLLHDRDTTFDAAFGGAVEAFGLAAVRTAPRSPWQSPYVERVIGSIRRECLDHVIALNERHLRRVLRTYVAYYQRSRTHLGLGKDAPVERAVQPAASWCDPKSEVCTTATNGKPPDRARTGHADCRWKWRSACELGSPHLQNGIRPPTFGRWPTRVVERRFLGELIGWQIAGREVLAMDRLRICRSIVEAHHGRLWAAANSPRGARFCFTLPANGETLD
jgi:hypothetical protein